ncbi:winged helix-turn-helix domain-containing protein [Streptomyces sp. NPDC001443]
MAGLVVWFHRELPAEVRVPFSLVVERVTGAVLSRASLWRLLTSRLGWSLQQPERRAVERDESEIARWIAQQAHGEDGPVLEIRVEVGLCPGRGTAG